MSGFKKFDFIVFHTPMNEQESKEVYLVVDDEECLNDESTTSILVMEIHQTISIPCVNTFRKRDFKLFYRPTDEEVEQIKQGKKVEPQI